MLNRLSFKLIVFDWDGTLLNSVAPLIELIEEAKRPVVDTLDADILKQSGLIPILEQIITDEHALQINDLQLIMELAGLARVFKKAKLYEGVRELLAELHAQGYKLALVSGRIQAQILEEIYRFDIGHYFSSVIGTDKGRSKPDPSILLDIVKKLNCSAEHTLMIGDSALDMEMAMLADIPRLAAAYVAGNNNLDYCIDCLKPWYPIAIVTSVTELHHLLLEKA